MKIQEHQDSLQHAKYYWRYDAEIFPEPSPSLFMSEHWEREGSITGSENGRGTTYFFRHAEKELVLRHYLRGGLVSKINKDRYAYTKLEKTRSFQEFNSLVELYKKGFNVPRPIAAQVIKYRNSYQADIVVERIPNAKTLIQVLQKPQATPFFVSLGQHLATFFSAGVHHTDLNVANILYDGKKFWLIDFDQAKLNSSSRRVKLDMLSRLQRSFAKETRRHGIQFEDQDWENIEYGLGSF